MEQEKRQKLLLCVLGGLLVVVGLYYFWPSRAPQVKPPTTESAEVPGGRLKLGDNK